MLPYYHGRRALADVSGDLKKQGDYLLIADGNELLLCVRDEDGAVHRQPVVKREGDGKFVIEGKALHHAQGFTNVEELITYYEVYGMAVKVSRIVLLFPVFSSGACQVYPRE